MAACSACGKRNAMQARANPMLLLPLRLAGLKEDGRNWCQACVLSHYVAGGMVWAVLALLGWRLVSRFL